MLVVGVVGSPTTPKTNNLRKSDTIFSVARNGSRLLVAWGAYRYRRAGNPSNVGVWIALVQRGRCGPPNARRNLQFPTSVVNTAAGYASSLDASVAITWRSRGDHRVHEATRECIILIARWRLILRTSKVGSIYCKRCALRRRPGELSAEQINTGTIQSSQTTNIGRQLNLCVQFRELRSTRPNAGYRHSLPVSTQPEQE
jgi:hypothetical protein